MSPAGTMSAERIAFAMRSDPQFSPPLRPKLVNGLVVVTRPDGVLIEGSAERQYLRGAASASLLPKLLAQLDGTADVARLAAALGESESRIAKAVALLYACGLLEEGKGNLLPPDADREVATFLSRHVDTTRANPNTAGALGRLADATVQIVGPEVASGLLADELRTAGVGAVTTAGESEATLAVGIEDPADADALLALEADCAERGTPMLRVAQLADAIEIGPRFERGVSCCYACFAALRGDEPIVAPTDTSAIDTALLIAAAAADTTWLLARTAATLSTGGVVRITTAELAQQRRVFPSRPGCEVCASGPPVDGEPGVPTGYAYDRSVAFPPRHLLNVKDHQHHYRESNLALQSDAKDYPNAQRLALGVPEAEREPGGVFVGGVPQPSAAAGELDVATLAGLLARTAGVRGVGQGVGAIPGKLWRWAPSGGNLGSVGVYIIVGALEGIAPGVYFYAPRGRELQRLAPLEGQDEATALLREVSSGRLAQDTPLALVTTGALIRVASKYGTFAYRTVSLDVGCALGQLHAAAAGYGLTAESATDWDDERLGTALGLNEFEPVTALVGIRPAAPGQAGLVAVRGAPSPAEPSAAPRRRSGADFEPTAIYRAILSGARRPVATREVTPSALSWPQSGPTVELSALPPGAAIEQTLRARRSVRAYATGGLPAGVLSAALRAAATAPVDALSRGAIELCVLAQDVEGLAQGLWSVDLVRPELLTRRNDLPSGAAAEDIVLQREYAHAPAVLLMLGSFRAADAGAGDHGYRLLLRAGTLMAQSAWLGAISVGGAGSIFAGLLPDAVERLCGGGPFDRAQLIGLALGVDPASP